MTTALHFAKPSIMTWAGTPVSDHNRSEVAIEYTRIGSSQRTWNGSLRIQYINSKKTFTVSWENLPGSSAETVDGFMGANALSAFYETNIDPFTMVMRFGDGTSQSYVVHISEFSCQINKRGTYDMWNVSATLEEI